MNSVSSHRSNIKGERSDFIIGREMAASLSLQLAIEEHNWRGFRPQEANQLTERAQLLLAGPASHARNLLSSLHKAAPLEPHSRHHI
jgi:hypothetical protein